MRMRASDRAYSTLLDEIQSGQSCPRAPCSARWSRPRASASAARRCARRSAASPQTGWWRSSRRASPSSPTSTPATSASSSRCAARSKRPPPGSPRSEGMPRPSPGSPTSSRARAWTAASGLDAYYGLIARFDAALDASVANDYLTAALRNVRTHLVRVRRLARDNPDRLAASAAEHRLIASAIARTRRRSGRPRHARAPAQRAHQHPRVRRGRATSRTQKGAA